MGAGGVALVKRVTTNCPDASDSHPCVPSAKSIDHSFQAPSSYFRRSRPMTVNGFAFQVPPVPTWTGEKSSRISESLPRSATRAPSRSTVLRQYEHTASAEPADLNWTCAPQVGQLLVFTASASPLLANRRS